MANQIIEEMSEDLYEAWSNHIIIGNKYEWVMERLYNKGYRKIPENALVITRKEFERYKGFSREEVDEISETAIKNARKETAEKFSEKAKKWNEEAALGGWVEVELEVINNAIDEIAKGIMEG